MAQVDYYIRLDLKKEHEQGVQHIKYGDANTRVLRFFVHSGGKTYDISDKHVVLHFLKKDGTSGSVRCFHAAEKGTCYCIVSSQMSAVAGEVKCDLKIYSGDTLLHSPKFYLLVGTDALSGDTSADVFGDEKADKVEDAAAGNFAGLDVEGNLTDSGKKASDFAAAEHDHTYGDIIDFASGVAEYAPPGSEIIFPLVYMTDNTPAPFEEGEYWYAPTAGKLYVTVSVPGSGLSWDDVTNSKLKENNLFVYRTGRVYYCVGTELRETKAVPDGHTHTKSAITDFAHTHAQSDISGLSDALAGKAAASHSHTMADVENLDVAIGSKASKDLTAEEDNFASFDNGGDIQDSGKKASDFAAASHTHTRSDVTGLSDALAGKAPASHTHTKAQISDFSHTHAQADVSGLSAALAEKVGKPAVWIGGQLLQFNEYGNITETGKGADELVEIVYIDEWHPGTLPDTQESPGSNQGKVFYCAGEAKLYKSVLSGNNWIWATIPLSDHCFYLLQATSAISARFRVFTYNGTELAEINYAAASHSHTMTDVNDLTFFSGTCATAAATQAKVVECPGFALRTNAVVIVKFTNAQSYNGAPTLNINSTGAKTVKSMGSTNAVRYCWNAGEVVGFFYDGTNYVMLEKAIASTTYYGVTKLYTGAGSTSTALALTPASLKNFADASVCPYYSTSLTYAVGDKVRYGNDIYTCSTAITTAEAWNAAHWTQLPTLQEQIDALNARIDALFPSLVTLTNTSNYTDNCYVEYQGTKYYTQGDTINIPHGGKLRCYANCGPKNYLYVDGVKVQDVTGAVDYEYTVESDIDVYFDIQIASSGTIRITTK